MTQKREACICAKKGRSGDCVAKGCRNGKVTTQQEGKAPITTNCKSCLGTGECSLCSGNEYVYIETATEVA